MKPRLFPLRECLSWICTRLLAAGLLCSQLAAADETKTIHLRNETIIDGTVEQVVREVNPLMFYVEDNGSGNIHMVVDKTLTADDLQNRIRLLGANSYSTNGTYANTNVGPNHVDVSNTYVYEATRFTIIG